MQSVPDVPRTECPGIDIPDLPRCRSRRPADLDDLSRAAALEVVVLILCGFAGGILWGLALAPLLTP